MNDEQELAEFEAWWEKEGQYCRSGGGDYEKTFAYRAYQEGRAALQSQEPSDEAHRKLKERTEYLLRGHKAIFNQGPKKIDLQKHIKALDSENDRLRALLALIPKENKS